VLVLWLCGCVSVGVCGFWWFCAGVRVSGAAGSGRVPGGGLRRRNAVWSVGVFVGRSWGERGLTAVHFVWAVPLAGADEGVCGPVPSGAVSCDVGRHSDEAPCRGVRCRAVPRALCGGS